MSLAWGGFSNGRIPQSALARCINFNPLPGEPVGPSGAFLMAEAARQWSVMDAHYFSTTGRHLSLSEAYRDIAGQNNRYAIYKNGGNLAAWPGTSNHGWGRSVDIGYEGRSWVKINGRRFGFYATVPSESWHFDYLGGGDITTPPGNVSGASGKPTPILIPVSNGDNMIQVQLSKPEDKTYNGFIVDLAPGYIHHSGTMQEATVTMQVASNPDERHILDWENFKRVLLGHGIDRQFFEGPEGTALLAKLDAQPWGGLWSQEKANSLKLDAIAKKLGA